jgi:hypothetical protein
MIKSKIALDHTPDETQQNEPEEDSAAPSSALSLLLAGAGALHWTLDDSLEGALRFRGEGWRSDVGFVIDPMQLLERAQARPILGSGLSK